MASANSSTSSEQAGLVRFWPVYLLLLALQLPALFAGYYADDYVHQIALREPGTFPSMPRWNIFDFGHATALDSLRDSFGGLPWWTSAHWKVRFFRPLASLSHWLDNVLVPGSALFAHLVSLSIYAGLLLCLTRWYRMLGLELRTARYALLLFGLNDATVLPAGWIANRNSTLSALFLVLALTSWAKCRDLQHRRHVIGALFFATLAALSKESGCIAFALLFCLFLRARARTLGFAQRRCAAAGAIATAALALAYLSLLILGGYGTESLFYCTPWHQPGRYLASLLQLVSFGSLSLAGPLSLDLLATNGLELSVATWIALPLALALAVYVWNRARVHPASALAGALVLLAFLPEGGAWLSERLLFAPALGSSLLFALALRTRSKVPLGFWFQRLLTISLTLGSGLWLALQTTAFAGLGREFRSMALAADIGPPDLGKREVFLLQAPSALAAFSFPATWMIETKDRNLAFWPLQISRRGLRWTRIDDVSFELEALDEPFLSGIFEIVYRGTNDPIAIGQRWALPQFEVEVLDLQDGLPKKLRIRLRRSLDSPEIRFLVAEQGNYVHRQAPAIGESLILPAAPALRPFLP